MFDIKIGTLIPEAHCRSMLPTLNEMGFESYELNMNPWKPKDYQEMAKEVLPLLDGRPVGAIGMYGNTLEDEQVRQSVMDAIRGAKYLHCDTIGLFAGALKDRPFEEALPVFRKVFSELCAAAEEHGVRLALENCSMGGTWRRGTENIASNGDAWARLFDAVPSPALGLEWEPAHAMSQLIDPVAQLRAWAKKVFHVHGKDATIAWDVIRAHGIQSPERFVWDRTPGFGDSNWCDLITILMQNGYHGSIDIEGYHDPVFYADAEWSTQARSLHYLKDCRGGQTWYPEMAYNGWRTERK